MAPTGLLTTARGSISYLKLQIFPFRQIIFYILIFALNQAIVFQHVSILLNREKYRTKYLYISIVLYDVC